MSMLSHRLPLKVSQNQILTPGLVQMVTCLQLNRLELKDMITQEIAENPVLEETADGVEELTPEEVQAILESERTSEPSDQTILENVKKPSFETFLSSPVTLADHLHSQLSVLVMSEDVRDAAANIIGNLDENGYLTATLEEIAESGQHSIEEVQEGLRIVHSP